MNDLALHASMAKNRRPGRTGYSPRSLVFGLDERLVASGLNHYLEEPDDSSMQASRQDQACHQSLQIRKAAMKAIIELDHSDTWTGALRFPSRKAECAWLFYLDITYSFGSKLISLKEDVLDKLNDGPDPELS